MALNIVQGQMGIPVKQLGVVATDPASPTSGAPCRFGTKVVGVAVGDMDPTTSITVLDLDCVAELAVKGVDQAGNSAVNAGDVIYYVDADTPKLSKKNTGTPFGVAYGSITGDNVADVRTGQLVASAAITTIRVIVKQGL